MKSARSAYLIFILSIYGIAGCAFERSEPAIVRVMTSGGFTAAYLALGPEFERATGIALETSFGASSGGAPDSIPERLKRGEPADVVILAHESLDALAEAGVVSHEDIADLAGSEIGMAVRRGDSIPDISTPAAFVETVRNARSIAYSASASGTYLSTVVFRKLGLTDEIERKATRVVSERVGRVVARGEAEIGFQQMSELLPINGIAIVGPIPDELQKVTIFSVATTTNAADRASALALVTFLSSPESACAIAATGLEPIATPDQGECRTPEVAVSPDSRE